MNTKPVLPIIFFATIVLISCEKGPGVGGTSSIRGHVIVHDYNSDYSKLRDVYPGMKEDVYIIYGNDFVYGDKFVTGDSGQYEFNYLNPGTYTVYAYSKDSTDIYGLSSKDVVVKKTVEITQKHQTVEAPDIIIIK